MQHSCSILATSGSVLISQNHNFQHALRRRLQNPSNHCSPFIPTILTHYWNHNSTEQSIGSYLSHTTPWLANHSFSLVHSFAYQKAVRPLAACPLGGNQKKSRPDGSSCFDSAHSASGSPCCFTRFSAAVNAAFPALSVQLGCLPYTAPSWFRCKKKKKKLNKKSLTIEKLRECV